MHENALGIGNLRIDFEDVLHSTVLAKSCMYMFHQISCIQKNKPIKVYGPLNLCDAFFSLHASCHGTWH